MDATGLMSDLMKINEVARYLRLSRDTVCRMAQTGRLPASKIGAQWRFRKSDIDEWLEGNKILSSVASEDG